jgi:hypothetical protein
MALVVPISSYGWHLRGSLEDVLDNDTVDEDPGDVPVVPEEDELVHEVPARFVAEGESVRMTYTWSSMSMQGVRPKKV